MTTPESLPPSYCLFNQVDITNASFASPKHSTVGRIFREQRTYLNSAISISIRHKPALYCWASSRQWGRAPALLAYRLVCTQYSIPGIPCFSPRMDVSWLMKKLTHGRACRKWIIIRFRATLSISGRKALMGSYKQNSVKDPYSVLVPPALTTY
jgi:hypothetical protein